MKRRKIDFLRELSLVSLNAIRVFSSFVKRCKEFDWSIRSKADGHSSERRGLDFAKLSSFSCSQLSGPRYLRQFEVSTIWKRPRGCRPIHEYWRKQPRDSPKGHWSMLDYLSEEGTRSSIPTVMALYWKTSANLYRLNH